MSQVSAIVEQVNHELSSMKLSRAPAELRTGDIRKLSSKIYRQLDDKSIDSVLLVCEQLLSQKEWALGVIAYDWAYRVRNQYREDTYSIFESWLFNYVGGWGDCDDFCTHAFGALFVTYPTLFAKANAWLTHDHFPVRRAAAVSLIYPINKGFADKFEVFNIADSLLQDEHDLVRKGYGWMLKVYSQSEPEKVVRYLRQNHKTMPRVAFRYALEKLPQAQKQQLMAL